MEREYWHPQLTDAAWCDETRGEGYADEDADMDDDEIREKYADGRKYADTWDHVGDARDNWEPLADSWIEQRDHIAELEAERDALKATLEQVGDIHAALDRAGSKPSMWTVDRVEYLAEDRNALRDCVGQILDGARAVRDRYRKEFHFAINDIIDIIDEEMAKLKGG